MAITHHGSPAAETLRVALFARAVTAVAMAMRGLTNRKQFRRLHDMSDWELADIGLERSDLHDAWERRVDMEPTGYLDVLVRSRGRIEHAARMVS